MFLTKEEGKKRRASKCCSCSWSFLTQRKKWPGDVITSILRHMKSSNNSNVCNSQWCTALQPSESFQVAACWHTWHSACQGPQRQRPPTLRASTKYAGQALISPTTPAAIQDLYVNTHIGCLHSQASNPIPTRWTHSKKAEEKKIRTRQPHVKCTEPCYHQYIQTLTILLFHFWVGKMLFSS